ncbi:conserved hypothetical protein [Cupriavidus taiwanensis]|nr:conserved hypothetical protein [Cupriavidus taiwanensis]SOY85790.1 conserved hypothetical protein [Cupriavidus taiwanensis]SPA15663.1 conserved hypothetical protein [Cupriavidus taiwanensis]SPD44901.1 conserved protein of unknown function [Cupriavidus taiwanensis]
MELDILDAFIAAQPTCEAGVEMLRVTIELLPGGNACSGQVIASAELVRKHGAALATYAIKLREEGLSQERQGELHEYPRYATSIWDLVARGIAVAMTGSEQLSPKPVTLDVPVHRSDGLTYVRMSEIPEPAQFLFRLNTAHSTRPIIREDLTPYDCAFSWDWQDFLSGVR